MQNIQEGAGWYKITGISTSGSLDLTILMSLNTLRTLLKEPSILSDQGSIFLENQLSEQAELSEQGE